MKPEKLKEEYERLETMSVYEKEYLRCGNVCGVDEVGRGPLAGPVVAACVILKPEDKFIYLNDSKKVTPKRRDVLFDEIKERAIAYGIGIVDCNLIDEINILQATYEAMKRAIGEMKIKPDVCLIDAVTIPDVSYKQVPIVKGDAKSVSIAAASILAKVTRDRMMEDIALQYPQYAFEKNKGYGTKVHMEALRQYGPCPQHRKTFIKNILDS